MANDIFGGLGGLMKGLSGFMPQDDPNEKLMTAQSELNDLKKQEETVFAEIGRQAFAANTAAYPQAEKLRLIQANIVEAENALKAAAATKDQADQQQQTASAHSTCPGCGHVNPDGTNFCQECGHKLGGMVCKSCNEPLPPGTRFCGACGACQDE